MVLFRVALEHVPDVREDKAIDFVVFAICFRATLSRVVHKRGHKSPRPLIAHKSMCECIEILRTLLPWRLTPNVLRLIDLTDRALDIPPWIKLLKPPQHHVVPKIRVGVSVPGK